jgi:hypothetical protein
MKKHPNIILEKLVYKDNISNKFILGFSYGFKCLHNSKLTIIIKQTIIDEIMAFLFYKEAVITDISIFLALTINISQ